MKKFSWFLIILFVVTPMSHAIYKKLKPDIDEFLLRHYGLQTKAVIIDEKNTITNSFNNQHSYLYLFKIDGKIYKNNAADSTVKVGDSIEVIYDRYDPKINRPLYYIK